tara:strand:- start:77 stop:550 length:474 start_codon:yes stop_codon:yes gene_type:complete
MNINHTVLKIKNSILFYRYPPELRDSLDRFFLGTNVFEAAEDTKKILEYIITRDADTIKPAAYLRVLKMLNRPFDEESAGFFFGITGRKNFDKAFFINSCDFCNETESLNEDLDINGDKIFICNSKKCHRELNDSYDGHYDEPWVEASDYYNTTRGV